MFVSYHNHLVMHKENTSPNLEHAISTFTILQRLVQNALCLIQTTRLSIFDREVEYTSIWTPTSVSKPHTHILVPKLVHRHQPVQDRRGFLQVILGATSIQQNPDGQIRRVTQQVTQAMRRTHTSKHIISSLISSVSSHPHSLTSHSPPPTKQRTQQQANKQASSHAPIHLSIPEESLTTQNRPCILALHNPFLQFHNNPIVPFYKNYLTLLHLTNNLIRLTQTLHHLLTLLAPAKRVIAFLEQIVQFRRAVHGLE